MKRTALLMGIALTFATIVNAQTKVEVKPADLPKAISDKVAADYAGYAIQNVEKVTKDKAITYQVVVLKGTDKEKLVYDASGKFVKKVAVAAAAKKGEGKAKQVAKAEPKKEAAKKVEAPKAPEKKAEATKAPAQKPVQK